MEDTQNPVPEQEQETNLPAAEPNPMETPQQPEPSAEPTTTEPAAAEEPAPPPFPQATQQPKADPLADLTPDVVAERFRDNPKVLLQALGYDDFGIGALEYHKATGDLTPYLEAKSVDYTKVSDEQIVERKLREQYASMNLQEDEMALLIEDELNSRFRLNDELASEREQQLGRIKLKAEAAEYRQKLIERQAQFAPPQREPQVETPQPSREQVLAEQWNQVVQQPFAKDLFQSKTFQVGSAQNPFNVGIDNPQELLATVIDTERYQSKIMDENGQPNFKVLTKLALVLELGEKYDDLLINHGKTLGEKKLLDESVNPQNPQVFGASKEAEDVFTALSRKQGW